MMRAERHSGYNHVNHVQNTRSLARPLQDGQLLPQRQVLDCHFQTRDKQSSKKQKGRLQDTHIRTFASRKTDEDSPPCIESQAS